MMTRRPRHLLIGNYPADAIWAEVRDILRLTGLEPDDTDLAEVHDDTVRLFHGTFPGYRASTNAYHDLNHTLQVVLAMARLLDGLHLAGEWVSARGVEIAMVAAHFHDIGFIQTEDDTTGTGAKYTTTHEDRGIAFARQYLLERGGNEADGDLVRAMLDCTNLRKRFDEIAFPNDEARRLGQLLGTADLLGQMGDRFYLEKLPHLFLEFREADIGGYTDELDLLDRTGGFWHFIQQRFDGPLGGVYHLCRNHFRARFGIDENIYFEIIEHQIGYLEEVLRDHRNQYSDFLGRDHLAPVLARWENEAQV